MTKPKTLKDIKKVKSAEKEFKSEGIAIDVDSEKQPGQPGKLLKVDPKTLPQTVQPAATTPMHLVAMAVEQNADVDKLERLLAMQERWEANEARKAFVVAMSGFKAEHLTILKSKKVKYKNSKGDFTEYSHATLDNICEIVSPVLSKYGLSSDWVTKQLTGNVVEVTCVLTHVLGHSRTVSLAAGPDSSGGKNAIQAIGSTVSYLERYTLLAILGIAVKDQDDDGRKVSNANEVSEAMPEKEFKGFEKRMHEAKTVQALQNISKQATAAADKYKDEVSYSELKSIYALKKGTLENV